MAVIVEQMSVFHAALKFVEGRSFLATLKFVESEI